MEYKERETMSAQAQDNCKKTGNHTFAWFPFTLTVTTTIMVAWAMHTAFTTDLPVGNQRVLDVLMGNIMAVWLQSMGYWYGTTFGSSQKNQMIAEKEKP